MQFMNKVLYAREGAKNIMDRTLANFPKQIKLEVDGVEVELPEVDACISILFPSVFLRNWFGFYVRTYLK